MGSGVLVSAAMLARLCRTWDTIPDDCAGGEESDGWNGGAGISTVVEEKSNGLVVGGFDERGAR